jgi:CHASE3 domain sensor protein
MGLAAAAVAAALVTLFALLLVAILSYRDASNTARHAQQAIASANQLEILALDLETGLRGFIITRRQSSLKPWQELGREAVPAAGLRRSDAGGARPRRRARAR